MITGDRSFKPGHPRFDLQAGAVEHLEVLYWGPGALWGTPQGDLPAGKGRFFEVVSTQDPFFRGLFGWFWARRLKAQLNVQVHADLSVQNFLKRLLARFVLRRADSVRVVSEKLKAQVEALNVRAHITILPVYIDVARFKSVVREPDTQPTILWVGRFENEKDPLLALHVFKEVREKGIDARFVMLGAGALEVRLTEMTPSTAICSISSASKVERMPRTLSAEQVQALSSGAASKTRTPSSWNRR